MVWWILNRSKLSLEKSKLASLEYEVDWLDVGSWYFTNGSSMQVDFKINHGGKEYSLFMLYPSIFPDSPPMIYTKGQELISYHQYGAGGELCLEYRPDNWDQSITGADMVSSCHRLLEEEHPGSDTVLHAHSAHISTLGKELRTSIFRFLLTKSDYVALNSLQEHIPYKLNFNERFIASTLVSSIHFIKEEDKKIWLSDLNCIEGFPEVSGVVVRTAGLNFSDITTLDQLVTLLKSVGLDSYCHTLISGTTINRVLVGSEASWKLFRLVTSEGQRKIYSHATINLPSPIRRISAEYDALTDKKIGLIGCGSVGSKVAASLCRSGITSFLLIDEDILFPDNIVRNELDLEYVGTHKAYSLKERLLRINPKCDITTLRISLGGQESSELMSQVIETLGKCDSLIDATADPVAFNVIASTSTRTKTPMFWCEVFAGGIGGYVCRVRPDIEPIPLEARKQISQWCDDQNIPWNSISDSRPYTSENSQGEALVACDAEVSIIASHTTRFVIDTLTKPSKSIFPSSLYFIGFSSEWLFSQPFDTHPVDLTPSGTWGEVIEPISEADVLEILKNHDSPKE